MRTTLDIEDDVLQAAKELAQKEGSTTGQVLSALARRGLTNSPKSLKTKTRNGVPILPSRGELVTIEKIQRLMDDEAV